MVSEVGDAWRTLRDGCKMVRANVNTAVSITGAALLCLLFSGSAAAWVRNGVVVCDAPNDQLATQIITDSSYGVIITWQDFRDGRWDIYAQRVDSSGAELWTANGVAVCAGSGDQTSPRLISDAAGGAIIAWVDCRSDPGDIYAQRMDSSGIAQWEPGGVAVCSASGRQDSPQIATDGLGGATIVWSDLRGADRDLYAQRVDSNGAPRWGPNGSPVCDTVGNQLVPQITGDTPGGWVVAWEDWRAGHPCYTQKMDSLGGRQWAWQGVVVCSTYSGGPVLAGDDSGGAIVTWEDRRRGWASGYEDVYAQRIDSTGTMRWIPNGVPIFVEQYTYGHLGGYEIIGDGGGGAFIVCAYNLGTLPQCHVFVSRVNSEGDKLWDTVVAYTIQDYNYFPQIVSDGTGGVVTSWTNGGFYSYGIHAQRIDSSGAELWWPGGIIVCDTIATKSSVVMASDGRSGAILAWCDNRNGNDYNVYAHRVDSAGMVGVGERLEARGRRQEERLLKSYPNPFTQKTDIRYQIADLESAGRATVKIHDVSGRLVRTLVDESREPGEHSTVWEGCDDRGEIVRSGVYFCRLVVDGVSDIRRVVLLRQ